MTAPLRSLARTFSASARAHSTELPPKLQATAASLGFTPQTRQRRLDPLLLQSSARDSIDLNTPVHRQRNQKQRPAPAASAFPAAPAASTEPAAPAAADAATSGASVNFFTEDEATLPASSSSRARIAPEISLEDLASSRVENAPRKRNEHRSRQQARAQATHGLTVEQKAARFQGKRRGAADAHGAADPKPVAKRASRVGRPAERDVRAQRESAVARVAAAVNRSPAVDRSPKGLFGIKSLITPAVRGARNAESSFWATGMEASAVRKAEILRMAGEYSRFVPNARAAQTPADRAKAAVAFTLAMNQSVAMRRAGLADDAVKTYLP